MSVSLSAVLKRWAHRIQAAPPWSCQECREDMLGPRPRHELCDVCHARAEREAERGRPKAQVLAGFHVPDEYCTTPAWIDAPWPRVYTSAGALWPGLKSLRAWRGEAPRWLVFSGVNGCGKSSRAAHLLYTVSRRRLLGGLWVSEAELVHESYLQAQPRWCEAVRTDVLVLDEMGSTREPHRAERSWDLLLDLLNRRSRRSTILTTHRPLTKGRADGDGIRGESVEEVSPAIFDRLRTAGIVLMPRQSFRKAMEGNP